jgi:hypothetical protein
MPKVVADAWLRPDFDPAQAAVRNEVRLVMVGEAGVLKDTVVSGGPSV